MPLLHKPSLGMGQWGVGWSGGRTDTILRYTEPKNKKLARDFLSSIPLLPSVVGECLHEKVSIPIPHTILCDVKIVLLSRYKDNVYICLINFPDTERTLVKHIISVLLGHVYGIKLKWEPHPSHCVTWGEGTITPLGTSTVSLTRKNITTFLPITYATIGCVEWDTWVDVTSSHARLVWRSHFPSILIKCVWYALSPSDLINNFKSCMWCVGAKGLWRDGYQAYECFFYLNNISRVVTIVQLRAWAKEGRTWSASRQLERVSPVGVVVG